MNGTKPGVSVDPLRDRFIAAGMPDAVLLDGSQSMLNLDGGKQISQGSVA